MTTIKISQLPSATGALTGAELAPIVQDNVTKKVAVLSITQGINVKSFGAVCDGITDDTAAVFYDSNGNDIIGLRNDRQVLIPALQDFADDTAAAAGGIAVGALYRTASAVKVRVS